MKTLVDVLLATERYLRDKGVSSPRLEAELLLAHTLNMNRVQLYLSHDKPMSEGDLDRLRPLVARRGKREPMAWILGHQPFHQIDLQVGPGVGFRQADSTALFAGGQIRQETFLLLLSAKPVEHVAHHGMGSEHPGQAQPPA